MASLQIAPAKVLQFSVAQPDKDLTEILTFTNETDSPIAFKFKSTAPKLYEAKPTLGSIPARCKLDLKITLKVTSFQKESLNVESNGTFTNRFLVESFKCPQGIDPKKEREYLKEAFSGKIAGLTIEKQKRECQVSLLYLKMTSRAEASELKEDKPMEQPNFQPTLGAQPTDQSKFVASELFQTMPQLESDYYTPREQALPDPVPDQATEAKSTASTDQPAPVPALFVPEPSIPKIDEIDRVLAETASVLSTQSDAADPQAPHVPDISGSQKHELQPARISASPSLTSSLASQRLSKMSSTPTRSPKPEQPQVVLSESNLANPVPMVLQNQRSPFELNLMLLLAAFLAGYISSYIF